MLILWQIGNGSFVLVLSGTHRWTDAWLGPAHRSTNVTHTNTVGRERSKRNAGLLIAGGLTLIGGLFNGEYTGRASKQTL